MFDFTFLNVATRKCKNYIDSLHFLSIGLCRANLRGKASHMEVFCQNQSALLQWACRSLLLAYSGHSRD